MRSVKVFKPRALSEALDIRAMEKTIPLAGGTDLMAKYRKPTGLLPAFENNVLLLNELRELKFIRSERINGNISFEIGALTTLSSLLEYRDFPPFFKDIIRKIAAPGIRNMATIGGNICNASPAGDTLVPLYCLDATVELVSKRNRRKMSIGDFVVGPGKTALREDEILCSISFESKAFARSFYRKVGTRKANALSKMSFLGLVEINREVPVDVRIAFGAVAPTVVRNRMIEKRIIDSLADTSVAVKAAIESYSRLIDPIDDQRSKAFYRRGVAISLLKEFLEKEIAGIKSDVGS